MVGGNFQIYSIQITGCAFVKLSLPSWRDLIIVVPFSISPSYICPKSLSPYENVFLENPSPSHTVGGDTMQTETLSRREYVKL